MTPQRNRIAFVSRELAPFGGGGIAPYVRAAADLLGDEFEVTVFTTSRHRDAHDRLVRDGAEALPRARVVFVPEPRSWDARSSYNLLHAWSARVHEALVAEYGDGGPELVEFPDFLGEGCVTVQARRTRSPRFRNTTVCARAYGTAEMYDVLDGFLPREPERAFTFELERYALRFADAFLWPGGDVLGGYRRFYGDDALAGAVQVRHPFAWEGATPTLASPASSGPLRLLYFGRLERRKGVRRLLAALLGLEREDWRLTVVGADTDTAPLGQSMRALLEAEIAGDPRVELRDQVAREQVPALIDAHDVVVVPSLWECWPNVALEAIERGRPLVSTPTGGMTELVEEGTTGWLTADTTEAALRAALARLVAEPERARALDAERIRERRRALSGEADVVAAYGELCERGAGAANTRAADRRPLASVVIPYFEAERYVEAAVASAAAQTHAPLEIVIVNDGSFRPEDSILAELEARYGARVVAQANAGLGAARNLGIAVARGEYLIPLDADNVLDPEFAARAIAVLEADPETAYVTSWLRYIDERGKPWKGTDEGLRPIGNTSAYVERHNVAGDGTAVFRRAVFDRLSYSLDVAGFEDWTLYREMRQAGLVGHVIPEPLIDYRVRGDSMMRTLSGPREQWIEQAIEAHLREAEVEWTGAAS